jgi:hypothetical protein
MLFVNFSCGRAIQGSNHKDHWHGIELQDYWVVFAVWPRDGCQQHLELQQHTGISFAVFFHSLYMSLQDSRLLDISI